MTEYISREAALRANCYFCSAHLKDDSPCDEKCADYMKFMEIPAADVRPLVKAKWEKCGRLEGKVVLKCSVCNQGITAMFAPEYNFCPNCGADMREEA